MRHFVRFASIIFIFSAVPGAFAQAAAESVLLHGNVAAAGAKSGTSLGKAINKATNKINNSVRTTTQRPAISSSMTVQIERTPLPDNATTASARPMPTTQPAPAAAPRTSMIVSMQGGRVTRPATPKTVTSQSSATIAPQQN